jgi:hypothetical protein
MSRGRWRPDLAARCSVRGRVRRLWRRIARPRRGARAAELPLRHELGPDHRDLARCLDAEPDLPPLQSDDGHADVVADEQFLHQLPGQHQHRVSSLRGAERITSPRNLTGRMSGQHGLSPLGTLDHDSPRGPPGAKKQGRERFAPRVRLDCACVRSLLPGRRPGDDGSSRFGPVHLGLAGVTALLPAVIWQHGSSGPRPVRGRRPSSGPRDRPLLPPTDRPRHRRCRSTPP